MTIIGILTRTWLTVWNRKHASVFLVSREPHSVAFSTSGSSGTLETVIWVHDGLRVITGLAGPGLVIDVPEESSCAFRTVVFFSTRENHRWEVFWLVVYVDSASCELGNARVSSEIRHKANWARQTFREAALGAVRSIKFFTAHTSVICSWHDISTFTDTVLRVILEGSVKWAICAISAREVFRNIDWVH